MMKLLKKTKMLKRLTAVAVAAVMCISVLPGAAFGEELSAETETVETETTEAEAVETETTETETVETEATETDSEMQTTMSLNYVYLVQQQLELGEEQSIVISIQGIDGNVTAAGLYCAAPQGEVEVPMAKNAGHAILFQFQPDQVGMYTPVKMTYTVNEEEHIIDLEQETDISMPQFEVTEPSVSELDEEFGMVLQAEDTEAVGEVVINNDDISMVAAGKQVVVVLDPGHDSVHCGAQGNGLREENINLKIALYCKEELEKYNNVTVYLTRSDGSCLNTSSNGACMQARIDKAQSLGADLLVSLHADSSSNPNATGSLAIVAGYSGYRDDISTITQQAGAMIQSELEKLGLSSRGLCIRWSDSAGEEYVYPNGAVADWYAITRYSKRAGLPGIIIEHGFISSAGDVAAFLNSDDKLRELGAADAEGIAKYFGLTIGTDVNKTLVDDSNQLYTEDSMDVAGFIRNLYVNCLNREPSREEVSYWLQQVAEHNLSGEELARNFVFSLEFQQKNLSNSEFVERLYHIYLRRGSDSQGKENWTRQLEQGVSKSDVIHGFEWSEEFEKLCARYGIRQGAGKTQNAKLYTKVAEFVADYYRGFLNREPDAAGLENWTTILVNGGTAADLTKGFVFSPEFQNRNLGKEDFVECLYNTYLQRGSDPAGKQSWVQQLPTMSWVEKERVIQGFLYSDEYKNLCDTYGISIGSLE